MSLKSDNSNGTLCVEYITFFIISGSFLLSIKHISENKIVEKFETHFKFNNYFSSENDAVYEIMGKKLYSGAGHR